MTSGSIIESKGMRAIFQKKDKKKQVIACDYCKQ